MSAVAAKPAAGSAMNPGAMAVGIILTLILVGICYVMSPGVGLMALIGVIIGGVLTGAGVAGLFGGAWAAETLPATMDPMMQLIIVVCAGAVGGGLMMAITCMMVNFLYVFGMGIPPASGKVANDPITGDSQAEYKSQGTEGHGLPFVSFVGGVIGGTLGGAGGTLIYFELLVLYENALPGLMNVTAAQVMPIAVSAAGMFAVGLFLVNAVLTAYNITGTIEGPHDPKFKRWPRSIVASAVASALCGLVAVLIVMPLPI